MTTAREVYFNLLSKHEMAVSILYYVRKESTNYAFGSTFIELRNRLDVSTENIKKMEDIEQIEGFMFWYDTPDWHDFLETVKCKFKNEQHIKKHTTDL